MERLERKYGDHSATSIKLSSLSPVMTFTGYGSVFNNVDSYGDIVAKGAFRDAVNDARVNDVWPAMLLQHGGLMGGAMDMVPIGIWLELREDDHGLFVRGVLAETTLGRDLWKLMTMQPRAAITGLSIGYNVEESDTTGLPRGVKRRLTRVRLAEVSLVTFPANKDAHILRSERPSSAEAVTDRLLESIRTLGAAVGGY